MRGAGSVLVAATLFIAVVAAALVAAPPPVQGPRYSPPTLPTVAGNQLDILGVEIQQDNLPDAVRRLDSLLHDTPEAILSSADGGGTISLATWVDALGEEQRKRLAKEYDVQFGEVASRAVRKLNEKRSADPAEYLAIARRYPFVSAATDAIVAAAGRCDELGDAHSAHDLRELARAKGWKVEGPATSGRRTLQLQGHRGFYGLVPFAAPWFGAMEQLALDRIYPAAVPGMLYISTGQRTLAMRDSGAVLWSANGDGESDADETPTTQRPRQRGNSAGNTSSLSPRGPSFVPQVVCDDSGEPRLLLVRQLSSSSGRLALRAFRASDGKLLWSSDNAPDLRGLTIASSPAVVGRYVYALCADVGQQNDRLVMIALELTTGRTLWRSEIGSVARRQTLVRYNRPRDPVLDAAEPWQNLSAPCVSNDSVFIAPNAGCAIALDRFDGHLRWIRPYDPALEPEAAAAKARRAAGAAAARPQWPPPRLRSEPPRRGAIREGVLRWTTTPQRIGDVLLVAPLDNDRVVALDVHSGTKLWHTDDLAAATLIGSSPSGLAIFQERSLAALDREGDLKWSWDGRAVGPAVVSGDFVFIPTDNGNVVISASDGKVAAKVPLKPPDIKAILKNDSAKAALATAGALDRLVVKESDADGNDSEAPPQSRRSRPGESSR